MKELFKNQIVKNILSALAVAFFGFILLNLIFLFDFIYQSAIRGIAILFIPLGSETNMYWFPSLHGSFVVIIGIISWFVFRTKLRVLYKAIYMTVPVAVVLVTVGIILYRWQVISYSIEALLCIGTLYYFYRTKQPWIYYYTLILVSLTLAIYTLTGGEI